MKFHFQNKILYAVKKVLKKQLNKLNSHVFQFWLPYSIIIIKRKKAHFYTNKKYTSLEKMEKFIVYSLANSHAAGWRVNLAGLILNVGPTCIKNIKRCIWGVYRIRSSTSALKNQMRLIFAIPSTLPFQIRSQVSNSSLLFPISIHRAPHIYMKSIILELFLQKHLCQNISAGASMAAVCSL